MNQGFGDKHVQRMLMGSVIGWTPFLQNLYVKDLTSSTSKHNYICIGPLKRWFS